MRDKNNGNRDEATKSGYRPLNEGYSPIDKRGYVGKDSAARPPKAPQGGTGKTTSNATKTGSQGEKK
jgi:hypothetical protein